MPCQCPGTTGGAYCMRSRHSRWSLKFCRSSVQGQDLLTQDVMDDGVMETRHYRPSNLHAWKLWGPRAIPGKRCTWCQGPFVTHHSSCMNPIGQDSCPSVGRKDGMCFESEALISVPIWWCIYSNTDFSHQRLFHIARLWLLCCVHWVYDPAADPYIKLLFRALRLESLVQRRIMPKWDLHVVLSPWLRLPFTSECNIQGEFLDDVISLKWRTMKTGFLRQWMFVHWKRNIRDIMRSHISRWILETVKEAYTQADRDYDRVTAHEVRALSVSFMGVQLWPYLTSCQWRFGGHLVSSRIGIYVIWPVALMACLHWVQWW